MIKIGDEKLFSQTELLENFLAYLKPTPILDIKNGYGEFEISAIAAAIGEPAEFVRGFVTSRREG